MKKTIVSLVLILVTVMSCGNKPNNMSKIIGEVTRITNENQEQLCYQIESNGKIFEVRKYDYDHLLKGGRDIIANSDFQFLPYSEFRQKIIELYNIDPDSCYWVSVNPLANVLEIINDGYLDVDGIGSSISKDVNLFVNTNKMILHDDIHAFNWIKVHDPYTIIDQVQTYGVISNKKWVDFAVENTNWTRPYNLEKFLFQPSYDNPEEVRYFRKYMLDTLINIGVEMSTLPSILEDIEYEKKKLGVKKYTFIDLNNNKRHQYTSDSDELIDYLYLKIIETEFIGYIESRIDNDPSLLETFKNKGYLSDEWLKYFCENYATPSERAGYGKTSNFDPEPHYIVDDKDGYVNMREGKGSGAKVIMQIPNGTVISIILDQSDDWWKISYNDTEGYIHSSRLKRSNN